jgi:hypothetical protein
LGGRVVVPKQAFTRKPTSESLLRLVAALVAALSLVVNGCAPLSPNVKYLFAPEVRTCPPWSSAYGDKPTIDHWCSARVDEPIPKTVYVSPGCYANGSGRIDTVTVAQAANYAAQVEEEYIGAKAEYGSIPGAAGLLLIPAGASALALGALGESATAVSALGFGSAAILGGGYLLSNPAREKAYMAGADALQCLMGTMQPFDIEQGSLTLVQLCAYDSVLEQKKEDLQSQIPIFVGQLASYQALAGNNPNKATKKKLCYAEKLLKAANASLDAATSAYDSGTKYYNYSYDNAGYEMVNSVNAINNKVSSSMITTEPDLHALANNLSNIIPESAQKLAGIDKTATVSKAGVEKAKAAIAKAVAAAPKAKAQYPLFGIDEDDGNLYARISEANNATDEVIVRTPSEIVPKIKDCSKGFDQPGVPPDVLTLNPAGDITLGPGDTEKVTISGGKLPYSVRWLCDCYNVGVTAQTTYLDTSATIVIAASDSAAAHGDNTYPLMITDATGIGSPLNVVVVSKKADNSDTPDCESSTPPKPPKSRSKGGSVSSGTVILVAQAVAAVRTAAHQAADAAGEANREANRAEDSEKNGNKKEAIGAFHNASNAMVNAYSAFDTAQAKAEEARIQAGEANDSVLTKLIRTADSEVGNAAKSAAAAGSDAARAQRAAY